MKKIIKLVILGAIVLSSACINLSRHEREQLREFKRYGVNRTEVKVKHPALAGALNFLPGFGNFYLAAGTDEGEQWTYGFLNLLVWPFSVLWGVPQGAIDADTMNKRETIYYYTTDSRGILEYNKLKKARK